MANKRRRSREHRRERRKAKASDWRRGPKQKMSGAVAHGPTGSNLDHSNSSTRCDDTSKITKVKKTMCSSSSLTQKIWDGTGDLAILQEELQRRDTKNFQIGFEEGVEAYWNDVPFEDNPFDEESFNAYHRGWNHGWQLAMKEVMSVTLTGCSSVW